MTDQEKSLIQLHKSMRSCRICLDEGHEITPPAIFSGRMGARIMSIGQAPGITEVEANRPFNAGSGQRLFKWLAEAGLEETWYRTTQYMTSVTKCYPGRSASGSGDRVPSRIEQEFCHPYLEREIELINPALIIPIGRLAINLFFPKSAKLTDIIGTQKEVDGRFIVPLPHSSGASRWHQIEANRLLIEKAISLIGIHVQQLFPEK